MLGTGGGVCKIASVLHVVGAFHDALQLSSGGWIAGDEFPRRQNCSIALELLIIRCEFWMPINQRARLNDSQNYHRKYKHRTF